MANPTYALANIADMPISKTFRFSGQISEWLLADFDQAYWVNLIALVNHNITDTGVVWVHAGTTSAASNFSVQMPWRQYDMFKFLTTAQQYEFWKITVVDADNPQVVEIGYLMIGLATEFSFNFAYGMHLIDEYENLEVETEFGVRHVVELFGRVRLEFPFRNRTADQMNTLRLVYRSFKRGLIPLFLIPDSAGTDGYFVRCDNNFDREIDVYQTASLSFLEESRGKRIAG